MKEFLKDLGGFLVERKKLWLLPFIAVFLLLSLLIAAAQYSTISPFIYTLF